MSQQSAGNQPIRVVIQQPALPKYRIPVFRELAHRAGIGVKVYYGASDGTLPNVAPEGFSAEFVAERVFNLGPRRLYWHSAQWQAASGAEADVLVMAWSLPYISLVPALLRAKRRGVPTILWGHGYSKREAQWRAAPRRRITGLATAVLFYNHSAANQFLAQGYDPKRVFVALNSLDQTPIQAARSHWLDHPDQLRAFQRQHELEASELILFVSRLETANRVDMLLQAAKRLQSSRPQMKIAVIGKGEAEGELRRLTSELGLQDRVIFTGAIYDEKELAPWFLSSKVFCYPANIGLSLLHSFGYGLPVITSDRIEAQNPEIEALEHGRNGLLYREGDVEALAAAIDRVLADSQLASQLSERAHETATRRFTLSNMVDGMEAAVRYCVANRGSR